MKVSPRYIFQSWAIPSRVWEGNRVQEFWSIDRHNKISYLQVKDEVVEAFLGYAIMEANCKRKRKTLLD